jgi:hypothetical protein
MKFVLFQTVKQLKKRLDKNRPMTSITLRMPINIVDDLKRIAPILGFSGYQALLKAYVGQGLRKDLEKLGNNNIAVLVASLKKQGVNEDIINEALAVVTHM